jgi:phenylacetate-coenzyme A ligase PaaK-like adenylate-forming protein
MPDEWFHKVFSITEDSFDKVAFEIFKFQYEHNTLYKAYADMVKTDLGTVDSLSKIPFLPIQFFKSHQVKTTEFAPEIIFESSGTTQTSSSHHYVKDIEIYRQSFLKTFESFYGRASDWCILGLLPSYLERKGSSLVFMVDELIQKSGHEKSGFYLYDYNKLFSVLKELEAAQQKTLLIGVSFALLDFAEKYSLPLKHTTIMETGGMKGRREEMIRSELHERLKKSFQVAAIHSEYGMTELLSQAYSKGSGIFHCPPWLKVLIRDEEDPLQVNNPKSVNSTKNPIRGAINIIDLANVYSCSFIATDDAGKLYSDGSFEVLGRLDNSDIRGCSLMAL